MSNHTQAAYATLRDKGGTFTPDGYAVEYHEGYMVSGFAPTKMVSLPPEARWDAADVARRLREYVDTHAAVFIAPGTTTHLGTWVYDDGENVPVLYIDASRHYDDRLTAIAAGIANGELSVWDCAAEEAVQLTQYRRALQGVDTPPAACLPPRGTRDMYGNNLRTGDSWGR
jgi:hypothetical protein